jgi:translation elongation factor EF-G
VTKGLEESMTTGSLAGFPVVDITATLYDGSYHEVDSSALAFQVRTRSIPAAHAALRSFSRVARDAVRHGAAGALLPAAPVVNPTPGSKIVIWLVPRFCLPRLPPAAGLARPVAVPLPLPHPLTTPLPPSLQIAARGAFRDAMGKCGARLLEPVMKVEVITPEDHMGDVIGDLNSRRGMVGVRGGVVCRTANLPGIMRLGSRSLSAWLNLGIKFCSGDFFPSPERLGRLRRVSADGFARFTPPHSTPQVNKFEDKPGGMKLVQAFVPLAEMFQYVSVLRGMTKGRAQYSMQLERYEVVPPNIQTELVAKARGGAVKA